MLAAYLRPAFPSLPVLYLMCPLTLYGSPELDRAREFPFSSLLGFDVTVEAAEDDYSSNQEWALLWPSVRRRVACGVFLDHLGGWVARGVYAEVADLLGDGKPVWWWNGGDPTEGFGFAPQRGGDWRYRYRRVGLGWPRPCRSTRCRPIVAEMAAGGRL